MTKKKPLAILDQIEEQAQQGATLDEILQTNRLTKNRLSTLYHFHPSPDFTYKGLKHHTHTNLVKKILQEENKRTTFYQIWQETDLTVPGLGKIGQEEAEFDGENIPLIELLYDDFVLQGLSLGEMIPDYFKTRQRADQYLIKTGQKEKWKEKRKEKESKKAETEGKKVSSQQQFLTLLQERTLTLAKDDWPLTQALNAHFSKKRKAQCLPLSKLVELFQLYSQEPYHPRAFGQKLGLHASSVTRQIRLAGLNANIPFRKPRICISDKEKKRLAHLHKSILSYSDLAYFTNLPYHVITQNQLKSQTKPKPICWFRGFTYRKASEIDEAQSVLSPAEIQEALDLKPTIYQNYLEYESITRKTIISELHKIYPEIASEIDQPWVTKPIKTLQESETQQTTTIHNIQEAISAGATNIHSHLTIKKHAKIGNFQIPFRKPGPKS